MFRMTQPDSPGHMTHVQNPVTRSEIKLNPPFWFDDENQLSDFIDHIELYCVAAWNLGRLDPAEISAPYGWADSNMFTRLAMSVKNTAVEDSQVNSREFDYPVTWNLPQTD